MYSTQDWARILSNAQKKAKVEVNKITRDVDVVHSCDFDQTRMAELEARIEVLEGGMNQITQALTEMNEELAKAQGMLKFCYAICQNPGVKDLADRSRDNARASLGSLAFGKFGNRPSGSNGAGRGGAAWRPTP